MTDGPNRVSQRQRWSAILMLLASVGWVGLAVHTGDWWLILVAAFGLTSAAASWPGARRATHSDGGPFRTQAAFFAV